MPAETNVSELKAREHTIWTGFAPGWRKHDEFLVQAATPVTERMLALLPGALMSAAGVGVAHCHVGAKRHRPMRPAGTVC